MMNLVKQSLLGAALAGLTLLSGCGLFDGDEDITTPAGQSFTYNGNTWRVSDDRAGRLIIVAINPKLAGLGTEAASRHSIAVMPEAEYRAAATGWLTTTGRFCTPGAPEALPDEDDDDSIHTGYQYHYDCWNPA